jgi:histidinol dehydrogenase
VYDFVKASSWLEISKQGLKKLEKDIVRLAELEGLTAHGDSVRIRLQ